MDAALRHSLRRPDVEPGRRPLKIRVVMSYGTWIPAYVGVGSNLDDPQAQVARGIDALIGLRNTRVIARSRIFRSAPMGPQDQPHFANREATSLHRMSQFYWPLSDG